MMLRPIYILFLALMVPLGLLAQTPTNSGGTQSSPGRKGGVKRITTQVEGKTVQGTVLEGDTIPLKQLPHFSVVGTRTFASKKEAYRYRKLKRNVKKVYPYAKLAGERLRFYSDTLAKLDNERQRKKFMKIVEGELKAEYGDELKSMTVTQGRILIKLIDRETENTSFALVQDFRGNFQAFFWQSFARIFGHNLKSEYDPKGEDKMIEDIVVLIEEGQL